MAQRKGQHPRRPPLPTAARTHEILERLAEHPHVEGCYVGHKRTRGRAGRTLAVVCAVREKRPRGEVAKQDLLPQRVEWTVNSREKAAVRTDVQVLGESGFQAAVVAGPGDRIDGISMPGRTEATLATVGVALRHPRFGPVVTTAGHAVQHGPGTVEFDPAQRPSIRLQNVAADGSQSPIAGTLLRSARIPPADYALIAIEGTPVANLYHDADSLGGMHVPQPDDVGKPFFVLTAAGVVPTRVRGVFGVFTIGEFPMRDLILTDPVTEGGDSGCALIDASFRVAGLLVGFITIDGERRSVFMSAFWALTLEQSELL